MKKTYLVEFSRTEIDENGHRVPVLPWKGLPVNARFTASVDRDGNYSPSWFVAVVSADEKTISEIEKDPGVTPIPDGKATERIDAKPQQEMAAIVGKLTSLRVPVDRIRPDAPQKEILETLGKTLRSSFVAEAFDIQEIEVRSVIR